MKNDSNNLRHISVNLNDQDSYLRKSLYNALSDAVEKDTKKPGARVLDAGVGRGELLERLKAKGYKTYGIDLEQNCVEIANRFGTCKLGKLEDLPTLFSSVQFDVVVCSHVLEHLDSPYLALNTLASLDAENYIFAVPNLIRPVRILRALFGSKRGDHPEHVHGWACSEFISLLSRCGFYDFHNHTDRVTINPFHGFLGSILTRLLVPLETKLLPKLFPMLSSSIIVQCRLAKRAGKGE